jgi:hypothetical protein
MVVLNNKQLDSINFALMDESDDHTVVIGEISVWRVKCFYYKGGHLQFVEIDSDGAITYMDPPNSDKEKQK